MTYVNKEYQVRAIEELVKSVSELLNKDATKKVCVFQSPTGSGKTFMMAKFIEEIISELPEMDFCFLWVSIGKGELHKQSKKSLERVFDGFPKVNLIEEEYFGSKSYIEQNEIVVANWEKLYSKYSRDEQKGKWKNKIMREGELINFIDVLQNTKEQRKIILIIDESHYAGDAQRTSELRDIINADVTLEMSATPKIKPTLQDIAKGIAKIVYVEPKAVIDEGMIKKELIINENIKKLVDDEKDSQEIIIEAAFKKRIELKEAFKIEGTNINPLCLIQLPNAEEGEAKKEVIEVFLAGKGITESNRKLAIWLSEEKSDGLDGISDFESEVEFLLFKQAIDTGWDCPRAHILVKLRDIKSYTFEVQTVGRILRMPEQKHYKDENLNTGFIFTNLSEITVHKEDYNPNIIKHLKSNRKKIYKTLSLESYYKSRVDYGDIEAGFTETLEKVFCKFFDVDINYTLANENLERLRKKNIVVDIEDCKEEILIDIKLGSLSFDNQEGTINSIIDERVDLKLSDNDLLAVFEDTIRQSLSGFAPKRSIPTVKQSIYLWCRKYLSIQFGDGGLIKIQKIIVNQNNIDCFKKLISNSTDVYKPIKQEKIKERVEESESFELWEVKNEEFYNQHTDELVDYKLCIYDPCYLGKDRSTPEKEFEKHLETKADKIDWWFKNGVSKKDYFGIKYEENDLPQTFYPDYIIQLKTGKIFIGDTKGGFTAKDATLKAEALQKYIIEHNLIGGIIIKDINNQWRLNQQEIYSYDINDLTKWEYFDDIL